MKLEENCQFRGTDNVQGEISEHMFEFNWNLLCLLSFKYFLQHAQFRKLGNIPRYFLERHLNGIFSNSGKNSMKRFILCNVYGKKVIPIEVFPSCRFYQNSRTFLYHLSTLTNARLFTAILQRKHATNLSPGSFKGLISLFTG